MPLGGAKDEHFSCFLSSCQLGVRVFGGGDNGNSDVLQFTKYYHSRARAQDFLMEIHDKKPPIRKEHCILGKNLF